MILLADCPMPYGLMLQMHTCRNVVLEFEKLGDNCLLESRQFIMLFKRINDV